MLNRWEVVLLSAAIVSSWPCVAAEKPVESGRYEKTIADFEARDLEQPPPKDGILFVGSSTIRLWDLAKCFPGMPAYNRGFGGSMVSEVNDVAERIVFPYAPKAIVFYSGDNDIAHGKTPEQTAADFRTFRDRVREKLPQTHVFLLSIKPSNARWELWPKMQEANRLLKGLCEDAERFHFLDTSACMLDAEGKPRKDLLLQDGLHLNEKGYELWTGLVMPHLKAVFDGAKWRRGNLGPSENPGCNNSNITMSANLLPLGERMQGQVRVQVTRVARNLVSQPRRTREGFVLVL